MKKLLLAGVIATTAFSSTALASELGERAFNQVGVEYYEPADEVGFEDMYGVSGSFTFADNFYTRAQWLRYDDSPFTSVEVDEYYIGVGYQTALMNKVTGFADVNYYEASAGSADTDGYVVRAGGIYHFNKSFDAEVSLRHVDVEDSSSRQQFELVGRYYINDSWSAKVNYLRGFTKEEFNGAFGVGVAYHF